MSAAAKKDVCGNKGFGAKKIAEFWALNVRGQTHLRSPSAVDVHLTIFSRLLCIEECDTITQWLDETYGKQSIASFPTKLQEIISRCGKPARITWFMQYMKDSLESKRLACDDYSVAAIKTGSRSYSDCAMMQFSMKRHLLTQWLDAKDYPPYVKEKVRVIFASWDSWRQLWHPFDDAPAVDTTWALSWPKAYRLLLGFLETAIYMPSAREEHAYRHAVRMSQEPEDVMTNYPFTTLLKELTDAMTTTAEHGQIKITPPANTGDDDDDADNKGGEFHNNSNTTPKEESSTQLVSATNNLIKQQVAYVDEGADEITKNDKTKQNKNKKEALV